MPNYHPTSSPPQQAALNEDIVINAGLRETTSQGPGRIPIDDLNINPYDYDPSDFRPPRRKGRRRGRYTGPTRAAQQQASLLDRFRQGNSNSGGSFSSAPSQSVQAPQTTKEKKYVRFLNIPGSIGGYVKAEWNEPGAIYAGERDVPSGSSQSRNVRVGSIGGASPASLSNSSIAPKMNSLPISAQQQIAALPPDQRAAVMAELGIEG